MYNNHSVKLTHFFVRLCYVLLTAAAIALPFLLYKGLYDFEILSQIKSYIIGPFYCVVPAGYLALACLDKLLVNIKKEKVFDSANIKLLRMISNACFFAGIIGLLSFIFIMVEDFMFETMLVLGLGELFMGLVVRVVKNVFESAIAIKNENDLTI